MYADERVPSSSDFENKFVCGEIMSYSDLHEHGSEAAVKAAGKLKQQGKTYESASPFLPFLLLSLSRSPPSFLFSMKCLVADEKRSGRWRRRVLEIRRVDSQDLDACEDEG